MARITPPSRGNQSDSADAAFAVHAALVEREKREPWLVSNPHWIIARQDAYERFSQLIGENGK